MPSHRSWTHKGLGGMMSWKEIYFILLLWNRFLALTEQCNISPVMLIGVITANWFLLLVPCPIELGKPLCLDLMGDTDIVKHNSSKRRSIYFLLPKLYIVCLIPSIFQSQPTNEYLQWVFSCPFQINTPNKFERYEMDNIFALVIFSFTVLMNSFRLIKCTCWSKKSFYI